MSPAAASSRTSPTKAPGIRRPPAAVLPSWCKAPPKPLSLTDSSSGWQASGTPGGTPGFADPVTLPPPGAIVVNEVMSNPTGVPGDMIEFYNTTSQPINIGGWFVSNNSADLTEYEIAAGTIIAAEGYPGDYYVLTEDYNFGPTATDPGRLIPFVLNPDGDNVYLSSDATIMPAEAIGSITCSGTTATVTMALADGYSSGDKVQIAGASPAQYDGLFAITVTGPTTFTYSMSTSPGGAASGAAMTAAWIPAGVAGGYQVQQAIHSMPPGYAYGLYTKSDGGAELPISSITLSGTTATVTMETTDTTLQNGNQVDIEGAAQTQYDGSVVIANVTVNSVAGTTTFTYTVLGSPASPATPIAGESLVAAAGSTNFTLLRNARVRHAFGHHVFGRGQQHPLRLAAGDRRDHVRPQPTDRGGGRRRVCRQRLRVPGALQPLEFPRLPGRLLRYGRGRLHAGLDRRRPAQRVRDARIGGHRHLVGLRAWPRPPTRSTPI